MRKIKVITTQHKPYYDLIGKDCIESFLKYWPKEISMELWAENFVPDISDPRLIIKEFNKINPRFENFKKLLDLLKKDPPTGAREKWGGSFQA